ncbi:MAG: hypothetical protein HRU80_10105 [Ignavibacteriales bacterium]|nr:hypothetical protein [Ignavibacteriaceae bacterium]QOJ29218.1 MAG: hypothetical protein HRU80_10105 [Ignavibacteriales bacterium]
MKEQIQYFFLSAVVILIIVLNYIYFKISPSGEIVHLVDGYSTFFGTSNGLGIDGMFTKDYAIFGFSPSILFIIVTTIFLQNSKLQEKISKSNSENIQLSSILVISLTILTISILCSPYFVSMRFFENPYYFIVIGVFFCFVLTNIFNMKDILEGDGNRIIKIGITSFLIGCSLAIETSNYFDFFHNEGTNIHRDINGAIIVPYNFMSHLNLPGYFLWRGLLYFNIITLFYQLCRMYSKR